MTATPKNIIATTYAANSVSTEYTASNVRTVISNFTAVNISASSATLTVHVLRDGAVASDENIVIKARTLQAGESVELGAKIRKVLESNDSVAVLASAASAITIDACGVEYSL